MYQTITNAQLQKSVQLQDPIDNRSRGLSVGLKSITYTVGWYNILSTDYFESRPTGYTPIKYFLKAGLYNVDKLKDAIEIYGGIEFSIDKLNGIVTLKRSLDDIESYAFSDNLIDILGLDEKHKNTEIIDVEIIGTRIFDISNVKTLNVFLNELNSTENIVDGYRSYLLTKIGIERYSLGSINTIKFNNPEYKKLMNGSISELNIKILDNNNKLLDNNNLPITILLHII